MVLGICLVCMGGCATKVNIFPEEINASQEKTFVMAVVPAKIAGVTLSPPDSSVGDNQESTPDSSLAEKAAPQVIAFDSLGGSLDSKRRIVTGVARESTYIEVAFEDILFVQVNGVDLAARYASPEDLVVSRDNAMEMPQNRIDPVTSAYWDVVHFDKHGGKYDPSKELLAGTSKRGRPVEIELDQVHHLQFNIYDLYKNMRVGVGLTGLVVFFLGAKNVFGPR